MSLDRFGWNSHFQSEFRRVSESGSEPARVALADRERFVVWREAGESEASVGGGLRHRSEDWPRESTVNPAKEIGHPELGRLSVGAPADVAVWELRSGDFGFLDAAGGKLTGNQRLECELTLRDGKIVWDRNGRAGVDYHKLGPTYGVRNVDHIIPPPR